MAKGYFVEHSVEFTEADIMSDLGARREMALMTGQFGVPVVVVGEHAMIGWDPEEFELLRAGRFKRR